MKRPVHVKPPSSSSSSSSLVESLPFAEAGEEEGAGEVEWSSSPSLARLVALDAADAQCDDSSDDSDGDEAAADGSAKEEEGEFEDETAIVAALCLWNGLRVEEAASASTLEVFQQHRYRRIRGLQAFTGLVHLSLMHQSQSPTRPASHSAVRLLLQRLRRRARHAANAPPFVLSSLVDLQVVEGLESVHQLERSVAAGDGAVQ
jgi:hypothetical protein